jgi:hypothetical protein
MSIAKKIIFTILIFFSLLLIWIVISVSEENREESKFYDIEITDKFDYPKPIEFLTKNQIDSLESINISEKKIIVIGNGYNGYDFYMWHKPTAKGKLYVKAYELTQKIELSETRLREGTKNEITEIGENYNLYTGNSLIYEGTFANYYPVRFELWFISEISGNEKKLTEINYVIDGWDR